VGALDEEDVFDEFDGLPPPLSWDGDEPPMELLEVKDSFSVGNEPARRPLEARAPVSGGGPAFSGEGFEQSKRQAPGFDWRRAVVAAGRGDVRQYDANKLRREQGPLLDEQRRAARSRLDPTSPESKQAQEAFASELRMYGQIPGLPDGIRGELEAQAESIGSLSAAQVERSTANLQRLLGSALRGAGIEGVAERAQQGIDLRISEGERRARAAAAKQGLEWSRLSEQERHNRVTEQNADPALKVQIKRPPETTLRYYRDRIIARNQIKRLRELLPKVRYLGIGADTANATMSGLPGGLDPRNASEREFASLIKRLRAPERKNIFGAALSKFDIKDSEGFMAGLSNNKEQAATNLSTLDDALAQENDLVIEQFPSLSGEPMPGVAPRPAAKAPAAAAPPAAAPAKVDKVALAQKALADPKASAAAKAKAKEILDAAGIAY
jgi:hypothetical protein